jgi:transposase
MEETFQLRNKPTSRNSDLARTEVKALVMHHNVCSFNNTVNILKWLSHSLQVHVFMPIIRKAFLASLKIQEAVLGEKD